MCSQRGGNQSVERGAAVLRALRRGPPAQRVSDIAGATGLSFSTASRLLATLEAADLVRRAPDGQGYGLGPEVLALAGAALNHHTVHRQARPVAQRLAWELGLGAMALHERAAALGRRVVEAADTVSLALGHTPAPLPPPRRAEHPS
ncbi:helix-turn-helix domain-containing protein [Streptomyces albiaxialis]